VSSGCGRGVDDGHRGLGGIPVSVRPAEEFVGDLRLVDAGRARDQSAVADQISLFAAPDGQQAQAAALARLGVTPDDSPRPIHRRPEPPPARASLGDEFGIEIGIQGPERPQHEPLGVEPRSSPCSGSAVAGGSPLYLRPERDPGNQPPRSEKENSVHTVRSPESLLRLHHDPARHQHRHARLLADIRRARLSRNRRAR